MATTKKVEETAEAVVEERELIVYGAGAVIESNLVLLGQAFANQDREALDAQMFFWENLNKTVARYRTAACKLWDDNIGSGYVNADWAGAIEAVKDDDGKILAEEKPAVERIVKKDPDKPRGRKPAVKELPSQNC